MKNSIRYTAIRSAAVLRACCRGGFGRDKPIKATFEGKTAEHKWSLKELDTQLPSDGSDFNYLVLEIRTSSPQRFSLWLHTTIGNGSLLRPPENQRKAYVVTFNTI
jgi:hypothetical protein